MGRRLEGDIYRTQKQAEEAAKRKSRGKKKRYKVFKVVWIDNSVHYVIHSQGRVEAAGVLATQHFGVRAVRYDARTQAKKLKEIGREEKERVRLKQKADDYLAHNPEGEQNE